MATEVARSVTAAATEEARGVTVADPDCVRITLQRYIARHGITLRHLFRAWDADESGSIDSTEFREAVLKVSDTLSADELDAFFEQIDADASGTIDFKELNKQLRQGGEVTLDAGMQDGAKGDIATRIKQKARLRKPEAVRKGSKFSGSFKVSNEGSVGLVKQLFDIVRLEKPSHNPDAGRSPSSRGLDGGLAARRHRTRQRVPHTSPRQPPHT
jgi:hypothetical protein